MTSLPPLDLSIDKVKRLSEIAKMPEILSLGINHTTICSWVMHGYRGRRLETIRIGKFHMTTAERVILFAQTCNGVKEIDSKDLFVPTTISRRAQEEHDELDRILNPKNRRKAANY